MIIQKHHDKNTMIKFLMFIYEHLATFIEWGYDKIAPGITFLFTYILCERAENIASYHGVILNIDMLDKLANGCIALFFGLIADYIRKKYPNVVKNTLLFLKKKKDKLFLKLLLRKEKNPIKKRLKNKK